MLMLKTTIKKQQSKTTLYLLIRVRVDHDQIGRDGRKKETNRKESRQCIEKSAKRALLTGGAPK